MTGIIKTIEISGKIELLFNKIETLHRNGILSDLCRRYGEMIQPNDPIPIGGVWSWRFVCTPWDIFQQWQYLEAEVTSKTHEADELGFSGKRRTDFLMKAWQRRNEYKPIVEAAQQVLTVEVSEVVPSGRLSVTFLAGYEQPRPVINALLALLEPTSEITSQVTKYPNMTRLLPHAPEGFDSKWLGLSDKDKENWEQMVTMIKDGDLQNEIARKLCVDKSVISYRLNTQDESRLSLGLKAEEIRRYLSS